MTYTNRIRNLDRLARPSLPLAAAVSSLLLATFGLPARAAFTGPAEGRSGAVATENAQASRAALEVMQGGGNAFDGAIAAALALGVVAPVSSGLGGGGFAVVYSAKDHKVTTLDFRETSPAKMTLDDLVAKDKPGASVGVPGEPLGLEWLSVHYAKKSLAEDAAPAVTLASQGFMVSRHLGEFTTRMQRMIAPSPVGPIFAPGGNPLAAGQTVQNAPLARTLARFGAEGSKPFYSGDFAQKIVGAAQAAGGKLEASDLSGYQVKERAPLTRTFGSRTVATMPAPSAGGLMQLEVLSLFGADASSPLAGVGFGSSYYIHMLAEGMRSAVADRARLAGDPDLDANVGPAFEQALDPAQIAARRARIEPTKTHAAVEFHTREEGTAHIVVADADGNVVSLTATVNAPFGARLVAADTGIVLNDELDDFTTQASDVQGFGVVGLGPNRPRGGARPVSSMAPAIVLENGKPILTLGGSGGRRIATATTQAMFARLVFGFDASACVSAPRFYTSGTELFLEPDITEDVRVGLAARGETVKDEPFVGTGVQMITLEHGGGATKVAAAADPRKQGFAIAW